MLLSRLSARRTAGGRDSQAGAAAVEFALVLPILLLLVFGIIQFGFFLAQQNALNGAVRTGARYGSVNAFAAFTATPHTCASVITKVRNAATTIGMDGSAVAVTVSVGGTLKCQSAANASVPVNVVPPCKGAPNIDPATPQTLTVNATFQSNFFVPVPLAGNSLTLKSGGGYQCEYNQ
jgi:Flp pilus assembly protein TadG